MSRPESITVSGLVLASLAGPLFEVELPNGHRIAAHLAARLRQEGGGLRPGDRVRVEMTPYDMSKGRITGRDAAVSERVYESQSLGEKTV
jgi:translation initiation factor IF-1